MSEYLPPLDVVAIAVAAMAGGETGALIGGDRIAGKLPRGFQPETRAVRVTRVGGTPTDYTEYLDRGRVQVEFFGATDADAFALGRWGLVDLMALRGRQVDTDHGPGVVTNVRTDIGLRDQPDPVLKAPRSIVGLALFIHPAPQPG